jgi:histidinol phosphatase-like enzyme (inositol monophosphatase family)
MNPDRMFFDRLADAAKAQTLPRFRMGTDIANKLDGGFDPVTDADRGAEQAIRSLIEAQFPDHGILGEEHGTMGLDRDYVWVIDPIDGTRAFISGLPVWGTLVGLYHKGRAIMGMLDQPFTGERYFADATGSFYRGPDGEKINRTRDCGSLKQAILFSTSPHIFGPQDKPLYASVERSVRLFRYGCDCYAYALLASGNIDLVVETELKPYDVGGLIAIIEQAGGIITTWDGGRPEQGGRILAAGSKAVHEEAMALLAG